MFSYSLGSCDLSLSGSHNGRTNQIECKDRLNLTSVELLGTSYNNVLMFVYC